MNGTVHRVILDACIPVDFRHHLTGVDVVTARYAGLQRLQNGALLNAIDGRFDVLVTVDSSLASQQSIGSRQIGLIIVRARTNRLVDLLPLAAAISTAAQEIAVGEVRLVQQ